MTNNPSTDPADWLIVGTDLPFSIALVDVITDALRAHQIPPLDVQAARRFVEQHPDPTIRALAARPVRP